MSDEAVTLLNILTPFFVLFLIFSPIFIPILFVLFVNYIYNFFKKILEKNEPSINEKSKIQDKELPQPMNQHSFDVQWEKTFVGLRKQCLLAPPHPPQRPWTDEKVVEYNLHFKPFYQKWSQTWVWILCSPLTILFVFGKRIVYIPLSVLEVKVIFQWYEKYYSIYLLGAPVVFSMVHILLQIIFFQIDFIGDILRMFKKEAFWRDESNYKLSIQKRTSDIITLYIFTLPAKLRDWFIRKTKYFFSNRWHGEKKAEDLYKYGKFDWEGGIEQRTVIESLPPIHLATIPKNYAKNYYALPQDFWWRQYQSVKSGKSTLVQIQKKSYSIVEFYHRIALYTVQSHRKNVIESIENLYTFFWAFGSLFSNYYPPLKGEFFIGGEGSTFFTNYRLFFIHKEYPKLSLKLDWIVIPLHDLETYHVDSDGALVVQYRKDGKNKKYKLTSGNYVTNEQYNQYKVHFESNTLDSNQEQLLVKRINIMSPIRLKGLVAQGLLLNIYRVKLYNLPNPRYTYKEEFGVAAAVALIFSVYLADWIYLLFPLSGRGYWASLLSTGFSGEHVGIMLLSIFVSLSALTHIFSVQFVSDKNWDEKPHVIWYRLRDLFEIGFWVRIVLFFMGYFYL